MVVRNDVDFKRRGPREGLDFSSQPLAWFFVFSAIGLVLILFVAWVAGWAAA